MLKDTINKINQDFLSEAKMSPALLHDMAAMETYMSESYSGRILVELLQNADDANSSNVIVTEKDGNVIFANNGRPFNDNDVIAISRSGASEKKRGETIGYRGIGFKSSSFLSSEIIIYSEDTYFTFSKSRTAETLNVNIKNVPTIRIPFICDSTDFLETIRELKNSGYSTIFIFKNADKNILHEELQTLNSDLMLFLKHIKEIKVSNMGKNETLRVVRKVQEWGQEVCIDNKKWAIIKECIAFRYEDNTLIKCDAEDALYYTFLPTLDKSPFPFKINADFSTDPSRKHIRQDKTTKEALNNIASIIVDIIKVIFVSPTPLYKNFLLMMMDSISFSSINLELKNDIKSKLESNKILLFNNGKRGYLSDYKTFFNLFEDSVAHILRQKSHVIYEFSINPLIYDTIDGVEKFLSIYSSSRFSSQEIVDLLCDKNLIKDIPEYVYSLIFGKVINAYNNNKILSERDLIINKILIKEKDTIIPLIDSKKTSLDIVELLQKNDENQSMTNSDLKNIINDLGLEYVDNSIDNDNIFDNESNVISNGTHIDNFSNPIIPRWRSSENACIDIEKFLGNEAKDVSIQNLGYDVESKTPKGKIKYIEVKSISKSDKTFTITNNEYTAAHQYGENYYICLLLQGDDKSKAIYIQNPLSKLKFEKRIRQWEWFCEQYQGQEIDIDY